MIGRLRQGFSSVKRGNYGKLQQEDVRHFQSLLKEHQVLADQDSVQPYNKCYLNKYFGQSKLVLLPETTEQVSNIMKYCTSKRLAVVPQGGNTGLVGGSVPVFDEIVLSTRRFNKIENFDTISGVLSCEAGCILEKTNDEIAKHNYEIPFDLGAKGSCMLGANASTHASGKYFIKYGPFRGNILGLEVVLADGTILDMRSRIRKDNTGIDLKQLFISSEGTLGIITKLDINCVKMDLKRQVILMKTQKFENILAAVGKAKQIFKKNLNAIEYLDGYAYSSVTRHLHPSVMPVKESDHLLLLEVTTEDVGEFLSEIPDFDDSIMSTTEKEYRAIWKIREDIAEAANKEGLVHSYDFSFDIRKWSEFVQKARKDIGGYVIGYGHIGDGNLHLNICLERGKSFDETELFNEVVRNKGSISAQHGIGQHKPPFIGLQKSPAVLHCSNQLKKVFDPLGILNPYKVYDESK